MQSPTTSPTTPTRSHQCTNIIRPPSSPLTLSPVPPMQSSSAMPTTSQFGGGDGGGKELLENFYEDDDDDDMMQLHRTGLNKTFEIYRKNYQPLKLDIMDRFKNGVYEAQHRVHILQESNKSYKIYLSVQVSFYRASNTDEITSPYPTFNSNTAIVLPITPLTNIFKVLYANLMHQTDSFGQNGSGWIVQNLVYLDLYVVQYDSLCASSYLEMPNKFQRSYVNVKN